VTAGARLRWCGGDAEGSSPRDWPPFRERAGGTGPVGRDDVLSQLRRVVDEAMAGRGHLLLLAGEGGIGKTTLLTETASYAEARGARVAWGWGWPGEGAPGYWP
jgi:hypothetical protein